MPRIVAQPPPLNATGGTVSTAMYRGHNESHYVVSLQLLPQFWGHTYKKKLHIFPSNVYICVFVRMPYLGEFTNIGLCLGYGDPRFNIEIQ